MTDSRESTKYFRIGLGAIVVGTVAALAGAFFAHFTGLSELNDVGAEIYPAIPRGWQYVLLGQVVSLGGGLVLMGGIALAFLYKREMTWARASLGAALFTTLMIILLGIVPNEWLTLTQSVWEWTDQKFMITFGETTSLTSWPVRLPKWLTLNNELAISYAAVKDIVSGTYTVVVTGLVAVAMYQWQERAKRIVTAPRPEPVSPYGRPVTKGER